jgi:hypothetical protein
MKFADTLAHLSIALHDQASEHAELLRSLREDSRLLLAEERKLAHKAAAEGYPPVDWGERGFAGLMRGKSGPNGGFETDSISLAFYLTGYLVEAPHRKVAEQALAMSYCPLREVASQTRAMPFAEMRARKVCPKTKQHFFGPAFAAVLADPSLTAQCIDVSMCSALGAVYLDFVPADERAGPWALLPTRTRSIFRLSADDFAPTGSYRETHLYPFHLADLLCLIRGKADTPARAGVFKAPRKKALSNA